MTDADAPPDPTEPARGRRLNVLGTVIGVTYAAAIAGSILSAKLVKSHPAILLALSSRNRHLLLTKGTGIGLATFVIIPLLRLAPTAVAYFLLARDYGDQGKAWMQREAGGLPSTVGWAERLFDKLGPSTLVLFAGSQLAWLVAGLRRVPTRVFLAFEVTGIVLRVTFFWVLGERFKPQIERVLAVIGRFTWPLTALLIATMGYQTWRSMQRMAAQQASLTEGTAE
jgi:hypothetical protein